MYTFDKPVKLLCSLMLIGIFGSCGGVSLGESSTYNITVDNNPASEKGGKFLYDLMASHTEADGALLWKSEDAEVTDKSINIHVSVDPELPSDYYIENRGRQTTLAAKTEATMEWMAYQILAQLAEHTTQFDVADLPPATMPHVHNSKYIGEFSFSYRDPHFGPNLDKEKSTMLGTNSVESSWGIWGHNLAKVLGNQRADVFAKVDNSVNRTQICFANNETYKLIESYITTNYGDGSNGIQYFMIMPNDNKIVCTCPQCTSLGNTADNATPAVSALVKRLALRFPQHIFFTSAYLSTQQAPKDKWPKNTGVLMSTIDIPKGVALSRNTQSMEKFLLTLDDWKKCTPNIYIWDYAANFDDYLTPLPVLYGLKKQLEFYKSWGVRGVFLNASGYDYSTFDDMKTYAASALMINTDLEVDSLCRRFFVKFYPVAGVAMSNYYLGLEKKMEKNKSPYNMYGSFKESLSYLDKNEFVEFYNAIDSLRRAAQEPEKTRLNKLYTALSYTRMQVAYLQRNGQYGYATSRGKTVAINPEIKYIYKQLAEYKQYKDLQNYKEDMGSIQVYLNSWTKLFDEAPFENLLMHEPISILSKSDENYRDARILNDGVLGFEGSYHQGWIISSSPDLRVQFKASSVASAKRMTLRFLLSSRHHIYLPEKIEVYKDGRLYSSVTPHNMNSNTIHTETLNVDLTGAELITIRMYKNKRYDRSSLACDEIQLN